MVGGGLGEWVGVGTTPFLFTFSFFSRPVKLYQHNLTKTVFTFRNLSPSSKPVNHCCSFLKAKFSSCFFFSVEFLQYIMPAAAGACLFLVYVKHVEKK
jgi:hypothetical protein